MTAARRDLTNYPAPWRQGRRVRQNVYAADDHPILMAPDEWIAYRIVRAVNAYEHDEADRYTPEPTP